MAKKKKKRSALVTAIFVTLYIFFVLGSGLALAYTGIVIADEALALTPPEENYVIVNIPQGQTGSQIAQILKEHDIIKFPTMFTLFAKITKKANSFKYGNYNLTAGMDYIELCSALQKDRSMKESVSFTIPEGYEIREIIARLSNLGYIDPEKFQAVIDNAAYEYDFVLELDNGANRLEGYLFPDTYDIFTDESEESIINRMLSNFNSKFTTEMRERATELGMSLREIVILASLIEREAGNKDDMYLVSSVFHNRLNSNYKFLESCASVQYILKERKRVLSFDDIALDSPYNTYKYPGLPVAPVSNPGLNAIMAALYPSETNYFYFCSDAYGNSYFAETYEEHQQNVNKYV